MSKTTGSQVKLYSGVCDDKLSLIHGKNNSITDEHLVRKKKILFFSKDLFSLKSNRKCSKWTCANDKQIEQWRPNELPFLHLFLYACYMTFLFPPDLLHTYALTGLIVFIEKNQQINITIMIFSSYLLQSSKHLQKHRLHACTNWFSFFFIVHFQIFLTCL